MTTPPLVASTSGVVTADASQAPLAPAAAAEAPGENAAAAAASNTTTHGPRPIQFLTVDGPVDEDTSIIRYDVPYAPDDPKKSAKYRQRLGLQPEVRLPDANARAIVDGLISPRQWYDEQGLRWVQHASPYPAARIDVVRTKERIDAMMRQRGAKPTGVCPIRSFICGEGFAEMIREVVAESWERGLLLRKIHSERVLAQKAHRELFESRCGYALRLALKGEKDTTSMVARIEQLRQRKAQLSSTEDEFKKKCEDIKAISDQAMKEDEFRHNQELVGFKREAAQKKALLESLTAPTKK